jgi:hypothetical protein
MRRLVERAVEEEKLRPRESALLLRFYRGGLDGYTYLEQSAPGAESPEA